MPTSASTDSLQITTQPTTTGGLTVEQISHVAEGVCTVTLRSAQGGTLPTWTPGAHIDLELPNWITRQYSLCGDPQDEHMYRIGVRLEELSRGGSEYIHRLLKPGAELTFRGPRSTFPATTPPASVFIAGGIGITAVLSMFLRDHSLGLGPTLLYAGRSRDAMPFLNELPYDARVVLAPKDENQRVDLKQWAVYLPSSTTVAACGPSRMVTAVEEIFSPEKFHVHAERFRAEAREFVNKEFTAECARSSRTVNVGERETLMDALARADLPLAAGCREGVCGSCELRVLAGSPEHRDLIGAPEGRMYPCVSRSAGERLVLDI